jgi:hypothetical protein
VVGEPDREGDGGSVAAGARASAIMRVGLARMPSFFALDRYRPLPASSTAPAWALGTLGLLLPVFSVAGALSGWRATRRGSRLGPPAVAWCCLTAVVSVVLWVNVFTGAPDPSSVAMVELVGALGVV